MATSPVQKAILAVRQIPGDLRHPLRIRIRCCPRDVHAPRGNIDDEKREVRNQPAGGPYLRCEEVSGGNQVGV